jgi:type II secretory pathway pseudopilin PulG
MADQVKHDPGRQASRRRMRLLHTVRRPELVAPVVQRNIGVWLGLGLIVVIVGLDLVGGRRAELLGLLVGPPIVAASFVGPKRTVAVGVVALGAAVGYGRAVGVDLLAGSQGVPAVAIVAATVLSGLVARVRVQREGRLRAVTRVAEVAQRALLGGVPPALGSLRLAVLYASASVEASIGGTSTRRWRPPTGSGCWSGTCAARAWTRCGWPGWCWAASGMPPRTAPTWPRSQRRWTAASPARSARRTS